MSDDKTKVLFGGVTTQFEVKKLMESIATNADDVIEHMTIERVVGAPWKSGRYNAVVAAWRKTLKRERNVFLEPVPGVGYRVLSDTGKMKSAASKVVRGTRSIGRASVTLASVHAEKLDDSTRKTFDHQQRITNALFAEATKARKTIAVRSGEVESVPRPRLRAVNGGDEK